MARPSAPRLTPRPESQAAHVVAPVADDPHEQVLLTDTQALELLSPGGTSEYSAPRRWRSSEPDSIAAKSPLARESLRGLRAGVEAALVSWLLVTIPVIAAYVATVASPILGEASWWDAARSASAGWLLGLGQAFAVTGAEGATSSVTLTPLALTAVTAALLAGSVRRARLRTPIGFATAALAAFAVVAGAYSVAETSPTPRALITIAVVVVGAVLVGAGRSGALPALPTSGPAAAALAGAKTGGVVVLVLGALGAVSVIGALLANIGLVGELQSTLATDGLSLVILILAQLLVLPTLAVWALAWWLGPGFSIGMVEVTSTLVTPGPLPVLPIFAALPQAGPGPGAWVVIVPALLATLVLGRAFGKAADIWADRIILAVSAVVTVTAAAAVLAGLSGGAAGAQVGPLAGVGTVTAAVALAAAWLTAGSAAAGMAILLLVRRLDLIERFPILATGAAASRRVGARVAPSAVRRRFSRRS